MMTDFETFNKKAKQQLGYLRQYFYNDFNSVTNLEIAPDTRIDRHTVFSDDEPSWTPTQLGANWSGRDSYYWLRFTLNLPKFGTGNSQPGLPASQFVLHTRLGRTGGGGNSGFEGLIYIDDQIIQGVDSNHPDLYLDAAHYSDATLKIKILLWTGLEGGGRPQTQYYRLEELSYGLNHPAIETTYNYLNNIAGVVRELDDDTPIKYQYRRLLQNSFNELTWQDTQTVAEQCETVLAQIHAFIEARPNQKVPYTITAVGHTHIDVAWLWRLRHTREKITRSFSTVLKLMDEFPDYQFFQSTPQDYAFLEQDHPELSAKIEKRVAEGRWEANGATWLEPDTNIPSGESLTRQFLYGGKFFKNHFNSKQNVLWLPDVFGYSAALPQIMRGFNIPNFMTTKISWNDTNRMPHDTFWWEGIDGSRVLTHFITTVDANGEHQNEGNWAYTYNGDITPHTIFGSYHVYADKMLNSNILLSYGFGDGGGGPTRQQIQNIKILNELPGVPQVKQGRVDQYFDHLQDQLAQYQTETATWRGELYLEFHRGTYTSQGWIKKANRQAEFALRTLEIRYTTAWIQTGVAYPKESIQNLWEILMRNQFHDILPGSSIHEVYQDARKEFEKLFDEIRVLNQKLDHILDDETHSSDVSPHFQLLLSNSLAWSVTQPYTLSDGQEALVTIPGLSAVEPVPEPSLEKPTAEFTGDGLTATTSFYKLAFNADGQLIHLLDRQTGREFLSSAGGNVISAYEDRPLEYDNWNIDSDYPEKASVLHAHKHALVKNTALQAVLEFQYRFQRSTITQQVILYATNRRIDFETKVDWHEHQTLLRTAFDTTVRSDNARFDIQYGNVLRSTNANNSWEEAKFETVAHQWADLSQQDCGIALLNNAKYGYRVKNSELSLSLIKSGINPDYDADQGIQKFTYSILPHDCDWLAGGVMKAAAELNQPLQPTNAEQQPLFRFESKYPVAVDAIKQSENGKAVILRLHDDTNSTQIININAQFAYLHVYEVGLNEDTVKRELSSTTVEVQPYQVMTLKFSLQDFN